MNTQRMNKFEKLDKWACLSEIYTNQNKLKKK